jgi:hypothetical protein
MHSGGVTFGHVWTEEATADFLFILVNKINKYSKLATSLLTFAFIARSEFETRVPIFFYTEKKNTDPV